MIIKIDYMSVSVIIDTIQEKINIIEDDADSEKLFDMVLKSILNKVNIDLKNYKVEYKC